MGSLRRQEKPRLSTPLPDARTGGPSSLRTAVSRRLSHGAFSAARSTARLRTPTCSSAASLTGAETARSADPGQHLAATAGGATWRHLLPSRRAETTVIRRSGISDQPAGYTGADPVVVSGRSRLPEAPHTRCPHLGVRWTNQTWDTLTGPGWTFTAALLTYQAPAVGSIGPVSAWPVAFLSSGSF